MSELIDPLQQELVEAGFTEILRLIGAPGEGNAAAYAAPRSLGEINPVENVALPPPVLKPD